NKLKCLTIFLDLSKAFDSVNHTLLLKKIKALGFSAAAVNLVCSYLSNRTQCVKINSTLSSVNNVTCGVPQGSVLGPLLYILFTNDIFSLSNSNCKLLSFADDTSITVWSSNYKDLFVLANNLMESVYKWLSANKLSLNIKGALHRREKSFADQFLPPSRSEERRVG